MDIDTLTAHQRDVWAVACNYRIGSKIARPGARALVGEHFAGNGYERFPVVVRSRGGRWIRKWEDIRRLTNFRATCIPARHPMYRFEGVCFFPGKIAAEEHARILSLCARREATDRPKRDHHGIVHPSV